MIDCDGLGDFYYQLHKDEEQVVTEAEIFQSLNMDFYLVSNTHGRMPDQNDYYYSDGIGNVFDTSSTVINPIPVIERRLDSYFIQ